MKKKFSRILGVGLSLMLLASLLVLAAPASASTLSWGAEKDPSDMVENTVVPGINIIDVAANGDTIYAATNSTSLPLYKSTDGGATWTSLANTTSWPGSVSVKAVAVATDDADVVAIVTSANEVEYSTSGGSSWTDLNTPSGLVNLPINCVDVSAGTTRYVAAGGSDNSSNARMYTIKLAMAESWKERRSGASGITPGQTVINAVKFSPNFGTEKAIAVISGNGTSAYFEIFRYETGDTDWNGEIDYLPNSGDASWGAGIKLYTLTAAPTSADIAMPSSFLANDEGERTVFVAVANSATVSEGGITRLTDTNTADFDLWNDNAPGGIGSIAYHEDGMLFGGDESANQVYRWLSPLSGSSPNAERGNTLKQPGGVNMTVVTLSGDNVVAGTSGDESAVAVSTDDGYSFNDFGLIDTTLSVLDDVAVNADGSKVYLTTTDTSGGIGTYDTSVWLKASSWKRIFSSVDIADANAPFLVRIAPEDDTAVYMSSKATKDIWMSKNSGMETWKLVRCYPVTAIQDFAVESADVVYAIDTAAGQGASKTINSGSSWGSTKEPTKSIDGYMVTIAPNGDILIGDTAGYVAFSKDGGSTFERTKDFGTGNAIVVADDDYADNNKIYVGVGTDIKRGEASTTATPAGRGATTWPITGMAQVGDVTYALSANATQDSLLYMSLKLETAGSAALAEWSSVTASGETYLNTPQALKVSVSGTKSKLWAIDTASPQLETYEDVTSLIGPTLVQPAAAADVAVNPGTGRSYDITFIWERYSDSDIDEMQVQIGTDSNFDAVIYDETFTGITTDTIAKVIGPTGQTNQVSEFMPGLTYYWHVRNGLNGPMYSPWSETRSFTVERIDVFTVGGPTIGATSVAIQPTFTWGEYEGAIGYEIALAEDPTFAILDWSHTVDSTFYKAEETLKYSTTYYWRVRGVTGPAPAKQAAPGGPWVTGVFTTEAEPVETEGPAVIVQPGETPPAQVIYVDKPGPSQPIPDYLLWTIIGIGAILVIALIVLIVRTRRVA
ncbi:hypothetical protein ACFLXU_04695 [Chloroflexota bacterium]